MASRFSDTEWNNSELNGTAYIAELRWSSIFGNQVPFRLAGQPGSANNRWARVLKGTRTDKNLANPE